MKTRIVMYADKGKILTDGEEIYGKQIFLGENMAKEKFYEISEEEYNIQEKG